MPQGALDHRLRGGFPVLGQEVFFERPGIHADPDGHFLLQGGPDNFLHLLLRADRPGIEPQAVNPGPERRQGEPVVEMDIGDDGDRDALPDGLESFGRRLVGNSQADNLATRFLQPLDLGDRPADLVGQGLGHRLDDDRRPSPDRHICRPLFAWSSAEEKLERPSLPGDEALPAVGQPLDDVVEDDENDEEDENHEPDLHPDLPDLGAEIAPEQGLEGEDEDLAAVKDGDREKVDDAELEADEPDPAQHGEKSHLPGHVGNPGDLQRPAELLGRAPAGGSGP